MATAGAMAAADLVTTAGFDPPTALRKLGIFAKAVSNKGAWFCDPDRMDLIPWFAQASSRNRAG